MLDFAERADVDIPTLFRWARPVNREIETAAPKDKGGKTPQKKMSPFEKQFLEYHEIAMTIRLAAQSKSTPDAYVAALRPVNDEIREAQRDAMISYLTNQDELLEQGIHDADSLFEFFLIDVQMSSIVETTRVRQAVSTVQLFVQRCFMDLESQYVPQDLLSRDLWGWMKNYATWASNRKVFLYPENWIEPTLKDDKTPFFKELETELAQNELTKDSLNLMVRNYVTKLAAVSHLDLVNFYIEEDVRAHFFTRTRVTPFEHYHRTLDIAGGLWTPWQKMGIEIPHYVNSAGAAGSYIIPTSLSGGKRLIAFIPQIIKVVEDSIGPQDLKVPEVTIQPANVSWEIRMSWTEYLNGKWTPRQVSADIYKTGFVAPTDLSAIDSFVFLALKGDNGRGGETVAIALAAPSPAGSCPAFFFYDNRISVKAPVSTLSLQHVDVPAAVTSKTFRTCISSGTTRYAAIQGSYGSDNTVTWQPESSKLMLEQDGFDARVTTMMKVTKEGKEEEVKLTLGSLAHADSDSLMAEAASVNGMKGLIDLMTTRTEEDYYGGSGGIYNELKKPHAIYHWELGLHIPMLLVDHFLQGQQFEEALAVCRHVFDPIAPIEKAITMGPADSEAQQRMKRNDRLWKFRPFKEIETTTLERLLLQTIGSKPGENIPAVTNWREKPFLPHLVARERPIAYMRWVVTKYIEVLIAYGDFYFRQNTIDSLPNAIQLYMLASHLCGPRGEKIPRQNPSPLTYANLVGKLDAFSNAIVRMEEVWPISNQITAAAGTSPIATNMTQDALPTMFGFSTAFYFSIPDNPKMGEQRNLVDDRLFKIRHSQDINGILRKLPLFDPPLDPGLLIKAKAQGLQLSSVLSAINGPMPNYRFQYLLGRAMELANEVKSLGAAFLANKEKYDTEMINSLRATHETNAFAIGMDIKKLSLKEALMAQVAAEESRKGPAFRLDFYKRTLGIKTAAPGIEDDFGEEKAAIADPVTDGASRLLQDEKLEMDKYEEAQDKQQDVVRLDFLAGVFHALPVIATHATPLGCGVAFQFGPPNIAYGMQAASSALRLGADALVYQALSAGRKANSLFVSF